MALTKVEAEQLQAAQTSITSVGTLTSLSVSGALTSGDITISDSTPLLVLSDTGNGGGGGATAKILFANTGGNSMGIGTTGNSTADSDLIISTNAAGTYGGYLALAANGITDAQADILLEPKTDVRIVSGNLRFPDNAKTTFGDGNDLQISSAGISTIQQNTNASLFIQNAAADYDVVIRTDDGSGGLVDYIRADGSTGQVKLSHYGTQKFNTNANGINVSGGILGATTNLDDGFLLTITDSVADQQHTGFMIDYNVSGADTLSADRGHIGFQVDTDTSATGGNTADEHRVYSIHANTKATGDSDLVFGIHTTAEAEHVSGQISALYGIDARATIDHSGTATISNAYAVHGLSNLSGATGTSLTSAYGVYGKTLVGAGQDANVTNVTGTYGEVEIDTSGAGTTVTNAYVFQGQFDNDSGTDVTITNGYLFYGNYAGTTPTNAWGLYIADTGPRNYLGGHLHVGSTDTSLYNNTSGGGIMLGGSGTNRLDVARDGDVAATFNRSSGAGEVINLYQGGSKAGGLGVSGTDITIGTGDTGITFEDAADTVHPVNFSSGAARTGAINLGKDAARFQHLYLSALLDIKSSTCSGFLQVGQNVLQFGTSTSDPLIFYTNNDERMRLTNTGNLLVGRDSTGNANTDHGVNLYNTGQIYLYVNSTGNTDAVRVYDGNGNLKAAIDSDGDYIDHSDINAKENIQDASSVLSTLSDVKVRSFTWKADGRNQAYGFIAQELKEVVPEAVSAPETEDEMWGVKHAKLVPMLVKAVQEQQATITALEARIVQLENK